MKFNKCTKLIISLALILSLAVPIFIFQPLTVYADDTHYIGGEGSGTGYGKGSIGAGSANTDFFVYIVLSSTDIKVPNGKTQLLLQYKNVKKEPLAKQVALMYNLFRKVNRTRVPMCPQYECYLRNKHPTLSGWDAYFFLWSMYDNAEKITSSNVKTSIMLIGITLFRKD